MRRNVYEKQEKKKEDTLGNQIGHEYIEPRPKYARSSKQICRPDIPYFSLFGTHTDDLPHKNNKETPQKTEK